MAYLYDFCPVKRAAIERVAQRFIHMARQPTPESRQFRQDEKDQQTHQGNARSEFIKNAMSSFKVEAQKVIKALPGDVGKQKRALVKVLRASPTWQQYLDHYIGTTDMHPKVYSWRGAVTYAMRDVLVGGNMGAALKRVTSESGKGFQAITMADVQGPLRKQVPAALREYLPHNIVVEVDAKGTIKKVTDRFENEHLTLGVKITKMRQLVRDYNKIAKKVKRDFKSRDEIIKMSAVITAIIMETGIRPGKAGNGKVVTKGGEELFVETFGAITLGPQHVRFVRNNFAKLEFVGKMTSVNTAEIGDAVIIKVLNEFVDKALKSGTKFIFITSKGVRFTYSDLQRYFRENFGELSPTDFRKLKATEMVIMALREEQAALYDRIKSFAGMAKDDLKERIVEAIVDTFEAAISKSQEALSHDSAKTTVKAYINPEVILRFLSTGRVDDDLKSAVLGGSSVLKFDPQVFVDAAGKQANDASAMVVGPPRVATVLGDLLRDLANDLEDAGVRKRATTTVRLANRWVARQAAGTAEDITRNLPAFQSAYNDLLSSVTDGQSRGLDGSTTIVRRWANVPWIQLMDKGYIIAEGLMSTRSVPPRQAKGLEMALRLFYRSRRMPKDIYKWWTKNQKRLLFIIAAANKWPEKVEGGDELFKVGPFTIHNVVGISGAELEGFKKALAAAVKMARKNPVPGFSKVLYGDIYYVGNISNAHHAAWYNPGEDILYVRPNKKKWGHDGAQTLVHELGHRYWRKFASKSQKRAWDLHHFEIDLKIVEVPMPQVGDPLPLRVRGAPRGWRPTVGRMDKTNYWYDRPDGSEGTILSFNIWKVVRKNEGAALKFPTAYSGVNQEEHFCEALKLRAAGILAADHKAAFDDIWS